MGRYISRLMQVALVALVLASCIAASCQTGGTKDIAFRGWAVAHTSVMLTKNVEADLVCGRPTAPAEPLCVNDQTHGQILVILREAATVDGDLGRLIQATPEGAPSSADIGNMIGRLTVLVEDVVQLIPRSPQQRALAEKVAPGK